VYVSSSYPLNYISLKSKYPSRKHNLYRLDSHSLDENNGSSKIRAIIMFNKFDAPDANLEYPKHL
jgi:hypothetical protein